MRHRFRLEAAVIEDAEDEGNDTQVTSSYTLEMPSDDPDIRACAAAWYDAVIEQMVDELEKDSFLAEGDPDPAQRKITATGGNGKQAGGADNNATAAAAADDGDRKSPVGVNVFPGRNTRGNN